METQIIEVESMFSGKRMWVIRANGATIGTIHKRARPYAKYRLMMVTGLSHEFSAWQTVTAYVSTL